MAKHDIKALWVHISVFGGNGVFRSFVALRAKRDRKNIFLNSFKILIFCGEKIRPGHSAASGCAKRNRLFNLTEAGEGTTTRNGGLW